MTSVQREQIRKAFAALRKKGYFARMNFWCCQSCGWFAVPSEKADRAVFYHAQDAEAFQNPDESMHLAWRGDKAEICRELEAQGLKVVWPVDTHSRIELLGGRLQ